jgi:hypothetical protein
MRRWFSDAGFQTQVLMRCTPSTCRLEIVQQTSRLEDLREVPQPVMTSKPLKTRVITPVFPLLTGHPEKLLLISTENLSNSALASHFVPLIAELAQLSQTHSFLELTSEGLVLRD